MSSLLLPAGPVTWKEGGRFHPVPPELVTIDLASQLTDEFGDDWYAIITFADGTMTRRGEADVGPVPDEERLEFLIRMAKRLNREMHHGGHWVTGWAYNPGCVFALWRDSDGDMQIPVYIDDVWPRVRDAGVDKFVQDCQHAYDSWREVMFQVLQLRPEETIKLAQGEMPSGWKSRLPKGRPTSSAPTAAGWVH
jgi:hypothetical protein